MQILQAYSINMAIWGIVFVSLASLTMGQFFQSGVSPGIGGLGISAFFGNGAALFNSFFNTTITCAGAAPGFSGTATLRRVQPFFEPWWLRRRFSFLGGTLVFQTTTSSGTFLLVANERAGVEEGCSSDIMGPVIQGFNFFSNNRPGVIAEVTLEQNRLLTLNVSSVNMPFTNLERYAGIGLSMCTGLTTDSFGRQVCVDPLFACCKLGYNNKEAVLLPIP